MDKKGYKEIFRNVFIKKEDEEITDRYRFYFVGKRNGKVWTNELK